MPRQADRVLALAGRQQVVVHVCAQVLQVVGDGRAQAQEADAVVAARVLPAVIAHAQHLRSFEETRLLLLLT